MVAVRESLQHEIEQYLYQEARLIDTRRLDVWLELFAEDGQYFLPAMSEDSDPTVDAFIINEDRNGVAYRVARLLHGSAHTQIPPARTQHMISNVIVNEVGPDEVEVASGCVVFWSRGPQEARFAASCEHRLRRSGDSWQIVSKKVSLLNNDQATDRLPIL